MWKDIINCSNYEVSNNGEVRNKTTKHILKNYIMPNGYCQVSIKMDGDSKFTKKYVHRLVAEIFLDNPENKREVNHKDGNKENNSLENLEWITSSDNQKHRHTIGINKTSNRKIGAFDKGGKQIYKFNSITEAFKALNKPSRVNIDSALQGKQKTAYGYVWKYLN